MAKRRKSKLSHFSAGWEWAKANPLNANRYDSPEAKRRMQLGVELGSQALGWFSDGVDAWRTIALKRGQLLGSQLGGSLIRHLHPNLATERRRDLRQPGQF